MAAVRHRRDELAHISQLSCENCSERKVRCDKGDPCSRCKKTGATCRPVYRQRRARGRHVGGTENSDLRERLARLEQLLTNQHGQSVDSLGSVASSAPEPEPARTPAVSTAPGPTPLPTPAAEHAPSFRYLANDFWAHLIDEVSVFCTLAWRR